MIPTSSELEATELATEEQKMKMIGIIGLSYSPNNVGYKIHPDYWGKGYMTEALRLFIDMFWTLEGLSAVSTLVSTVISTVISILILQSCQI